jgi:hypothetical protein
MNRTPVFRSRLDPASFVRGVPPKPPNVQGNGRDASGTVPVGPRVVGWALSSVRDCCGAS